MLNSNNSSKPKNHGENIQQVAKFFSILGVVVCAFVALVGIFGLFTMSSNGALLIILAFIAYIPFAIIYYILMGLGQIVINTDVIKEYYLYQKQLDDEKKTAISASKSPFSKPSGIIRR